MLHFRNYFVLILVIRSKYQEDTDGPVGEGEKIPRGHVPPSPLLSAPYVSMI